MAENKKAPQKPEHLILDMVLIVEIEEIQAGGKLKKEPFISYRYPKLVGCADPFSKSVTQFCFPDVSALPTDNLETEVFSFVLTESDGDRRFGYCMRKLPQGNGLRYPVAFCVLSFFPCFPMFAKMLEHVAYHYENLSSQALSDFIVGLVERPLPKPGETFEVNLQVQNELRKWRFTRPNEEDSFLEHVDFEPLLNHMDENKILIIFASLLVERRTIFISSKLSLLSSCVQSLLALLYPLAWQHICIPVLPSSLLSFCCAPMPFVVGIMPSSVPEVMTLPMEEVLIVDVDNRCFLQKPSFVDDYQLLPNEFWTPVIKAVKEASKNIKKHKKRRERVAGNDPKIQAEMALYDGKIIGKALADVFLNFFVKLLGSYRNHITDSEFDKEGFIESQKTWEEKQFMELFCGSQMFEMFILQRKRNQFQASTFEKRVQMTQLETNMKMMVSTDEAKSKAKGKGMFGAFKKRLLSSGNKTPVMEGDFVISQPTYKSGTKSLSPETHSAPVLTNSPERVKSEFISEENGVVIFTAADMNLNELPKEIGTSGVHRLLAMKNSLSCLPPSFSKLSTLTVLDLSYNNFKAIPEVLSSLTSLSELYIGNNMIEAIPSNFSLPKNLTTLNLDNNLIQSLPASFGNSEKLKKLSLNSNKLISLPEFNAPKLRRLLLSRNNLESLPSLEGLKNLNKLNVDHNKLKEFPNDISSLQSLVDISAKSNKITAFGNLEKCLSLETINLDRNQIENIPNTLIEMTNLKTLSLNSNKITSNPDSSIIEALPTLKISLQKNPCSS